MERSVGRYEDCRLPSCGSRNASQRARTLRSARTKPRSAFCLRHREQLPGAGPSTAIACANRTFAGRVSRAVQQTLAADRGGRTTTVRVERVRGMDPPHQRRELRQRPPALSPGWRPSAVTSNSRRSAVSQIAVRGSRCTTHANGSSDVLARSSCESPATISATIGGAAANRSTHLTVSPTATLAQRNAAPWPLTERTWPFAGMPAPAAAVSMRVTTARVVSPTPPAAGG